MKIITIIRSAIMARCTSALVGCVLAVLFAGCDPEEIMRWAPDGEHALVRGTEAVNLIDSAGKIISTIDGARAWMPDSRRVITVRMVVPRDWAEYAALLGADRTDVVISAAEALRPLLRNYQGDWSAFTDSRPVERWQELHGALAAKYSGGDWMESRTNGLSAVVYYLAQKFPQEAAPLLKAFEKEPLGSDVSTPQISELVLRSIVPGEKGEQSEQLLARTVDDILWCRAEPHGRAIAYVLREPARPALYVVPATGGDPARIDEGATEASWTADGIWLAYIKTTLPFDELSDHMGLGTITRRRVCSADGKITVPMDEPEDLAGLLLGKDAGVRVACLPDDRILFAGVVVKLPSVTSDLPREVTLFTLRAGDAPALTRVLNDAPPASLPNRLDRFVVNPTGDLVAVPGDSGEVAVVSLKHGTVETIQAAIPEFKHTDGLANGGTLAQPAPAWRGPNELCYVVPRGHPKASAHRAEVVMQTLHGEAQTLSKTWPDSLADRFLPRAKQ